MAVIDFHARMVQLCFLLDITLGPCVFHSRCQLMPVIVEVDRILRPGGSFIVRDNFGTISEIENLAKSLHWEIRLTYSKDNEGLLYAQKSMWRPTDVETSTL